MNEYKTPRIGRVKLRTIDIQAKEWFDKVNGNSYWSARVTLNFGLPSEKTIVLPFQYGYGDFYQQKTAQTLRKMGVIKTVNPEESHISLRQVAREHGIIVRASKSEAKQRDVKAWGTE